MEQKDEELISLIARCAIRDQSALKQLVDRLSPYLNAVAFRIMKTEDLSNDVLQEAFVQIWTNAASYRPDRSKPLTWMTSIVRYRALDRLEREKKHRNRVYTEDDDDPLDRIESDGGPESDVQSGQERSHIENCMEELNEKVGTAIKLAYIEGYSREEIAERFQTNANTVKSWLRRGAERLKQCLEAKLQTSR